MPERGGQRLPDDSSRNQPDAPLTLIGNDDRGAAFARQVRDALAHLYDPAYLQTHPLVRLLPRDREARTSGVGRALRQLLLDAIEALRPVTEAGSKAASGTSYQILQLRYVEGLDVPAVRARLALGRSEYYREQQRGLEAVVSLLRDRGKEAVPGAGQTPIVALTPTADGARPPATSHTLPAPITSYIARAGELARVKQRLRESRLLTLTGSGGCGKTRLALEGSDQKRWADRLEDEHDNLRAALAWSLANPADSPALLRLAAVLGRFWRNRGYNREGIRWLNLALARSAATPSDDWARALSWLGHFEWLEGNLERARTLQEESVAQARVVGDRILLAQSLRQLSYAVTSLGDWARARRLLEKAVAVSRDAGYKREIAFTLHSLARVLIHEDATVVIEPLLIESLAVARESGDPVTVCEALFGLSWVYHRRGELARARHVLDECLALARRADVRFMILLALLSLGDLATTESDLEQAIDWYRQALRIVIDTQRGMAPYALDRYAAVCFALGDYRRALRLFGATSTAPRAEDPFSLIARSAPTEEDLVAARQALGDIAFASAWAEGQAMTLEEAIADAFDPGQ